MKVCLISALTMTDFGDRKLNLGSDQKDTNMPPLGVLSLAAVLIDRGIDPQVVNLNKLFFDFFEQEVDGGLSSFLTSVVQHIQSLSFDILGLSTICSSYPFTLQIAREVKRLHPHVKIILGGPQASIVDMQTMKAFPFVDFVVRGEAENTFPALVETMSIADPFPGLEKILGITFRKGEDIIRNADAPPILDLDVLPLPAYHLDPNIGRYKSISMEAGRGCPFNCIFCSTNVFFNRRFRLKSPQKIIEQMKSIKKIYGNNNINLIHDNFAVNREKVVEFCESVSKCGEDFSWSCSARTDLVDDELIALMAKSGCSGIFFGVETGSARMQELINKNLNLSDAVKRIRCTDENKIVTAVALITAFPQETKDDLRSTINFIVDLFRYDTVKPQLSLLAPLAGTQIHFMFKEGLVLDYMFSDISFQGQKMNSNDLEMIQSNPDIFPDFYSIPTSFMNRMYFKEVRDFAFALKMWFRWLPLALLQDSGDILNVFDIWRTWRTDNAMENLDGNSKDQSYFYYYSSQFSKDFIKFVTHKYIDEIAIDKAPISAIVEIENFFLDHDKEIVQNPHEESSTISLTSFPYVPVGLHIASLNIDYKELMHCLRNKIDLKQVSASKSTIAYRNLGREQSKMEIYVRLLTPLSEELLNMCDGNRTVRDIIQLSSQLKAKVDGISSDKVCFYGLVQLLMQGLIEISPSPIRKSAAQ